MERKRDLGLLAVVALLALAVALAWPVWTQAADDEDESAAIDVSGYPPEMQKDYELFARKCSACHGLGRAINMELNPTSWKAYIKKMMKRPDSGISPPQAKRIYKFMKYFERHRASDEDAAAPVAPPTTASGAPLPDKEAPPFDAATFKKGRKVFKRKQCSGCHATDTTALGEKGPGLKGIYALRGRAWLVRWLGDPEGIAQSDPDMKKLAGRYPDGMVNPNLKPRQLEQVLLYLAYDGVAPK